MLFCGLRVASRRSRRGRSGGGIGSLEAATSISTLDSKATSMSRRQTSMRHVTLV